MKENSIMKAADVELDSSVFYVNVKPLQYLCGGFSLFLVCFIPSELNNPTVGYLYATILFSFSMVFILSWLRKAAPLRVRTDGVVCQDLFGRNHFVGWDDMYLADPNSHIIGNYLVFRSRSRPRLILSMPLFLEDFPAFSREVLRLAPDSCPMRGVLVRKLGSR